MKKSCIALLFLVVLFFMPLVSKAHAAVTIAPATGGSAMSADTTGGSYTTLTGPTITEGSSGDIGTGTIILTVPSGFIFNTGAAVSRTITKDAGNGSCFAFSSATATPTTTTITFTVSSADSKANTHCHVAFSNIQVRPSSGTPLATGDITDSGTAVISGMTSSTSLGTLTETVGAKNKLAITQQPSSGVGVATDFSTKPIVALQDQFGNVETGDNTSTITVTPVLSTSSCGGTAGSGTITSTPSSGTAVTSGIMTYTAMQYSAAESIKLCFASSGVSSTLSNTIVVAAVSITITSTGTVSYGTVALNVSQDTTAGGLNDTQTVQNNSTIAEDFSITGQNTTCPWTLAGTNGANQYVHSFSINSGSSWTALATSNQSLATNIAANGTQSFDLKITMPTSTSCYTQQSVDVTVTATAH